MIAKIYNFTKPKKQPPKSKPPTTEEIFEEVVEILLVDWRKYAIQNKLNEFFLSKLPSHFKPSKQCDIVNDLNELSEIEIRLGIDVVLTWPTKDAGWVAGFNIGEATFLPLRNGIASEANSRAFNILVFFNFSNRILHNKEI